MPLNFILIDQPKFKSSLAAWNMSRQTKMLPLSNNGVQVVPGANSIANISVTHQGVIWLDPLVSQAQANQSFCLFQSLVGRFIIHKVPN